jgi:hypothetical protein
MEIRHLYEKCQKENIAERLAVVLVNAIILSISHRGGERLPEYLMEIRHLYEKYPDEVKKYLAIASIKYLAYLGKDQFDPNMDHLEDLNDIVNEYLEPFEIRPFELTSEEQSSLWTTTLDYDLSVVNISGSYKVIIAVDKLKWTNPFDPFKLVTVNVWDAFFQNHVFLAVDISDENIPINHLHIIICPLKIKNDNVYGCIIDSIIDQTYDPSINEFSVNNAKILLTDRNGLSILQNYTVRLNPDQLRYLFYRDRSALLTISSKFVTLSAFVRLVEGRDGVGCSNFYPNEYCPYCKEYSQKNCNQFGTT